MTRRYYRIRPIGEVVTFERDGIPFASTSYPRGDHGCTWSAPTSSTTTSNGPPRSSSTSRRRTGHRLRGRRAVRVARRGRGDARRGRTSRRPARPDAAPGLQRVVVATSGRASGPGISGVQHRTFRPGETGYVEDRVIRGLHPMMGKRLHLARLANFDDRADALGRGRLPLPRHGPVEPAGRAVVRAGRGARPDPGARRRRVSWLRCRSSSASTSRPSAPCATLSSTAPSTGACTGTG